MTQRAHHLGAPAAAGVIVLLLAPGRLSAQPAPGAPATAPQARAGATTRHATTAQRLPDLSTIPVPVLDVFEPLVARQLADARTNAEHLIAQKSREAMAGFGTLCLLYLRYELFDSAEPCLREARAVEPREFRWPYYLTFAYARRGDFDRAAESAQAALAIRPHDVPTLLRAGELHLLAHEIDQAQAAFDAALAADPASGAARFGLGRAAAARGDHATAIAQLEAALPTQPDGSIVHYHLGMEYRAAGDLDRARQELAKSRRVEVAFDDPLIGALEGLSESREVIFARGIDLLEHHRVEAAIAAFERVLELAPKDAQAHYNLARAQIEAGDLASAEAHLRAAIDAWPDFFDAHLNLAILLGRTGRADEAAQHIDRAVAIDPEHVPTRMLHARVLAERGDTAGAIADLEAALRLDPSSSEARLALAQLELSRGRPDAARGQLEQLAASAAASDRDRAAAQVRIARLPGTPPADATARLQAAVELDPTSIEARGALAERLAQAGRLAPAMAELQRLVELAPDDPRPRLGLATTLVLSGDCARARASLEESTRRFPDNGPLDELLARVLAAAPDASVRDGARAVQLARGLVERELTVDHVETLAMALAEAGSFDDAVVWQLRAIERETATGVDADASRRRLDLYRAHRAVREPWNDRIASAEAPVLSPR